MAYDFLFDPYEIQAENEPQTAEEMDRARDAAQWIEGRMLHLVEYDQPALAYVGAVGPPPGWRD